MSSGGAQAAGGAGDSGGPEGGPAGVSGALAQLASDALDQYGLPLGQSCIAALYGLYRRMTITNAIALMLKYIPLGLYMYKTLKDFHRTSRERIKQKQGELKDLQLQIEIVNTKLCVRESEFAERSERLRACAARLRAVRARVRGLIAGDDALRRALHDQLASTPDQDRDFIITLLKESKASEQMGIPDRQPDNMDCGEHLPRDDDPTPDNSVYSSLSEGESKPDCRVKIIKVTNVYKIAYLKHFIKQKRLRRATQQALLKKKIDTIKKLLEGWQKSLNKVINSSILIGTSRIDLASQGDYSKPNLREFSDSDSDVKTSGTDTYNDDPYLYRMYGCSYDDIPGESTMARDCYDNVDYNNDVKFSPSNMYDCNGTKCTNMSMLPILPEETRSQVAIEEIKSECDFECRDLVAL